MVAGDDSHLQTTYVETFEVRATRIVGTIDVVTSTENSNEEAGHRTSLRVATINGVSGWTAFQNSSVLSVNN